MQKRKIVFQVIIHIVPLIRSPILLHFASIIGLLTISQHFVDRILKDAKISSHPGFRSFLKVSLKFHGIKDQPLTSLQDDAWRENLVLDNDGVKTYWDHATVSILC